MQSINSQRAEAILPDVTDFLAGKRFEDFNESTLAYEITNLTANETMLKKIKYIASRYLVISYGLPNGVFTHAIVFDNALNKLGKLRIDHADVFEYVGTQTEVARESVAFLLATGEVRLLDMSATADASGVLILGKLQFVRSRLIDLLAVELENVDTDATLAVYDQVSLDGKNFSTVQGTLDISAPDLRKYWFRASGKNHSLVFIGKFNSVTSQITYISTGRR